MELHPGPGRLDPPVVGRFENGYGRFEWRTDPTHPTWRQSFAPDGGDRWTENWVMTLSRTEQVS